MGDEFGGFGGDVGVYHVAYGVFASTAVAAEEAGCGLRGDRIGRSDFGRPFVENAAVVGEHGRGKRLGVRGW